MSSDDWAFADQVTDAIETEGRARRVLGVTRRARPADVKRAYWRLARVYHPDANPGDAYRWERFMVIAEAYDILTKRSSPHRRYRLAQERGYVPKPLTEQAYLQWWLDQFGDNL